MLIYFYICIFCIYACKSVTLFQTNYITGLFDSLLVKIFYANINKNTLGEVLYTIIKTTHTNKGKSIPIICNRTGFKWYFKKYRNNLKFDF